MCRGSNVARVHQFKKANYGGQVSKIPLLAFFAHAIISECYRSLGPGGVIRSENGTNGRCSRGPCRVIQSENGTNRRCAFADAKAVRVSCMTNSSWRWSSGLIANARAGSTALFRARSLRIDARSASDVIAPDVIARRCHREKRSDEATSPIMGIMAQVSKGRYSLA
jgi:hypothetical protein